jgi:hypothetical protein
LPQISHGGWEGVYILIGGSYKQFADKH